MNDLDTILRDLLPPSYNSRRLRRERAVYLLTGFCWPNGTRYFIDANAAAAHLDTALFAIDDFRQRMRTAMDQARARARQQNGQRRAAGAPRDDHGRLRKKKSTRKSARKARDRSS